MHRRVATAALSVVAYAITLGAVGCSSPEPPAATSSPSSATSLAAPAPIPAPGLPDAAALVDVLYRLADPAVPGTDKLPLIEGTSPEDAPTIDTFANALRDNGFAPVTFAATAIGWSDRVDGDVTATVDVVPATDVGVFSFPMDFHPVDGGWQLSQGTADLLLTFGETDTDPTESTAPAESSEPGPSEPAPSEPAQPSPTP